jgi:hypothetical protein
VGAGYRNRQVGRLRTNKPRDCQVSPSMAGPLTTVAVPVGRPPEKVTVERVPGWWRRRRRPEARVMPVTVDQLRLSVAPLATKVSVPRVPLSG